MAGPSTADEGPAARREAVHRLRLAEDVDPAAVLDLVDQRFPATVVDGGGRRLGRHAVLADPTWPGDGTQVWEVVTLRERGDPPWPGSTDPDGLYRVFAAGMPIRSELRVVLLLLGLARRLAGDLVLDVESLTGARHLVVDPEVRIDLTVLSPHWLDPEHLVAVLLPGEPRVRLAVDATPWDGPRVDTGGAPVVTAAGDAGTGPAPLTTEQLKAVHAVADATDAAALAAPDVLDAYEAQVDVAEAGTVVVQAHGAEEVPAWVAAFGWPLAVAYDLRWWAPDPEEAQRDSTTGPYRGARRRAAVRLRGMALAVAEAGAGVVLDADGFELDKYAL